MAATSRDSFEGASAGVGTEPPSEREPDYYAVLGVGPNVSDAEIRAAFRRLTKLWHPDHHASDTPEMRARAERRMRSLLRAYDAIGTPAARAAYDARRGGGTLRAGAYASPDWGGAYAEGSIYAFGAEHPASGSAEAHSRESDTFAGTLGGALALLLALGIAASVLRSGGVSGPAGFAELLAACGLVALAVALFANASPLGHAADAFLAGHPAMRGRDVEYAAPHVYHAAEPEPPTAFERLVEEALAGVPAEFHDYLENVVIQVKDEPSEDELRRMRLQPCSLLLGLYEGVPLTSHGAHDHPPEIVTIFQRPIEEYCDGDPRRIRRQVRATVLHELAHHFGMDHDAMPAWIK